MSGNLIGGIFIIVGVLYGLLVFDKINETIIGYVVRNEWIILPNSINKGGLLFGKKPTIIFYALSLIFIGVAVILKLN